MFTRSDTDDHRSLPEDHSGAATAKKSFLPAALRAALSEMADLSIYKNWTFLVFSLASFLGMVAFYVPFMFIPDLAVEYYAVSKDTAMTLVSVIGGANICGRIFWGWLADRPRMDPLVIQNVCLAIVTLVLACVPACPGFYTLMGLCTLFGFFVCK